LWASFANDQSAAVNVFAIEAFNGRFGFIIGIEFNESETA
jgi:hypothetical protein